MKTPYFFCLTIGLFLLVWSMTSCVTTETTTSHPDGTVIYTRTTVPAAGVVETAAAATAQIIATK